MNTVQLKTLSNGLTLILSPQKGATTATVLVLVSCGSKYETKQHNGVSHFLEHMCFKGTKRRPRAIDISGELDALGANYNAFTGQEYTGYFVKVHPKHISRAIDIVADIYINQIFRPEELVRERGVIIEEINMYEDDPRRKIHDNLLALLYGDQPAGWPIAGTKKSVSNISTSTLRTYHNEQYVASATTVLVTGAIDNARIIHNIEAHFAKISKKNKKAKRRIVEKQTSPQVHIEHRRSDQTHLMFGLRSFPPSDKGSIALDVTSSILGGGMSSRLFTIIRERLGAAYYVYSSTDYFTDHGHMYIGVGAGNKRVKDVIRAVVMECKKLKEKPISERELNKVKEYMMGRLAMGAETSDELAYFLGNQYLIEKKVYTIEDVIKKISQVNAEDIMHVAKRVFRDKNMNLAVIGPLSGKESFERLIAL